MRRGPFFTSGPIVRGSPGRRAAGLSFMNHAALDRLIATIDELERLYAQAKDNPLADEWREMQKRLDELQEQVARLRPH